MLESNVIENGLAIGGLIFLILVCAGLFISIRFVVFDKRDYEEEFYEELRNNMGKKELMKKKEKIKKYEEDDWLGI